jgi:2-hydroxychromene-2-carboxylate isomerase
VKVQGEYSNIPGAPYVANPSLALTASQTSIVLNVQSVTASGTVTVNGAAPVATASCNDDYGVAEVTLTETTYGYTFTVIAPCENNTWNVTAYPGTYEVKVQGEYSNIPGAPYVANPALALTASQPGIALNVQSVSVAGVVTVNGAAPVATASCNDDYGVAEVTLKEVTYDYVFTAIVPCENDAWTATIYPGTYRVSVQGEYSNVPGVSEVVVDRITLP